MRSGLWGLGATGCLLAAIMAGCGGGGSDEPAPPTWSLAIEVTAVTASTVQLGIRANFGGPVPVWRDGRVVGSATLEGGTTVTYTDRDLTAGTSYCYQAGGWGLLTGEIWSDVICATPG
jgi:hypothetical protein